MVWHSQHRPFCHALGKSPMLLPARFGSKNLRRHTVPSAIELVSSSYPATGPPVTGTTSKTSENMKTWTLKTCVPFPHKPGGRISSETLGNLKIYENQHVARARARVKVWAAASAAVSGFPGLFPSLSPGYQSRNL